MSRTRLIIALAFHAVLLLSGISWAALRYHEIQQSRELPEPRLQPLTILPRYNEPSIVSNEQLQSTLERLTPKFRGLKPRMNFVDHALRFWGIESVFQDAACLSGVEMRQLMLDYRDFRQAWGDDAKSFLTTTTYGIRPRVQEGDETSSHVDHSLTTLAEVGTPLDYPVLTSDGETQLRAMLIDALKNFNLNQQEYEWSTLAFALYMPSHPEWFSTGGQVLTFDRLAKRVMRQPPTDGVCYGQHRLYTLSALLAIDDEHSILTPDSRANIEAYLQNMTDLLVTHQSSEGYWDVDWDGRTFESSRTPLSRRLLVTGHALEWWAIAPEQLLPPLETRERAAQWLCQQIKDMTETQIRANYTFLSHAGRALALWRGRFPHEFLVDGQLQVAKLLGPTQASAVAP